MLSLLPISLIVTACGAGDDDADGRDGAKVIATTGVLADIAASVAGPDAEVVQLIPDGVDVHGFEVSARDRQSLDDAALVVDNGAGLEAGIPLDQVQAPRWTLADEVGALRQLSAGEAGSTGSTGDVEERGQSDPHVWMDPSLVAGAAPSLAAALAAADPQKAARYRGRAGELIAALERLDDEIARELSGIPDERRSLVTSHDALGYFADRYGLTVIATPFPSSGPEAEPSAARLADVARAIEDGGVVTVFAQASDNTDVLETLARETGVEVVDQLLVASTGEVGGYEEMLRRDAMLISAALG